MHVVFFGSGAFGLPTLRALASHHTVSGVVSQPDRPAGRGGKPTPTPISQFAADSLPDVPRLAFDDVNAPEPRAVIRALRADAWVIIAFGQKLSPALLDDRFAVNLHASLLPRWRGAAPINAAILNGDRETGVSVITLADRMDAGLILAQRRMAIDPRATAGELHDALAELGPECVLSVLAARASGPLTSCEQNPALVTRAPKLSRADAWVDLSGPADHARRRIHALTPWPGVSLTIDGLPLKVLRVSSEPLAHSSPIGTLLEPDEGLVACGHSTALRLLEVQAPGRTPMPWRDYARGRRPAKGALVTSGLAPC